MSKYEDNQVALTPDQLKELISAAVSAAVAEAKKPYLSEAELKGIEQEQQMRKEQAESIKEGARNRKLRQTICTHMRTGIWAGQTRAVHVENGNFLICQGCHGVIRPESDKPANYDGPTIYSNEIFYRLLQAGQPTNFA